MERKESRWFLDCMEDKFLTQLVSMQSRNCARLDLLLVNRKGLVCDVKVGSWLGHRDRELIEFLILGK